MKSIPMSATLLNGKTLAQEIRAELAEQVADFIQNNGAVPTLAAVLVGDDPASEIYVRSKRKACEQAGIESQLHHLPADTTEDELLALVSKLNKDSQVHGILIQVPLPEQIDTRRVQRMVSPNKDVDAFHPENVGLLVQGQPRFLPCTPMGIQQLLVRSGVEIAGRHVVVVGRGDLVGKPLAIMLMQRDDHANATVTVCHTRTKNLKEITRKADILVVAIGQAKFVTADMIKPGAVVIDVGVNRTSEGLQGDVDFDAACEVAGRITPVPGGVGPLTIAMLLCNTLSAARELCR